MTHARAWRAPLAVIPSASGAVGWRGSCFANGTPMIEVALSSAPKAKKTDKTALWFLGGYFILFCSVLIGADSAWRAYREHVESVWPVTEARLSDCHIHTWYDSTRGRPRSTHYVECVFRYEVDGVPHAVTSRVGDQVSVVRGQVNLTRPTVTLSSLQQWVRRHPTGAIESVHYDPAHPEHTSLVGVDDDLRWQTSAAYARGALTFAAIGAGLLVVGTWLRRRSAQP